MSTREETIDKSELFLLGMHRCVGCDTPTVDTMRFCPLCTVRAEGTVTPFKTPSNLDGVAAVVVGARDLEMTVLDAWGMARHGRIDFRAWEDVSVLKNKIAIGLGIPKDFLYDKTWSFAVNGLKAHDETLREDRERVQEVLRDLLTSEPSWVTR